MHGQHDISIPVPDADIRPRYLGEVVRAASGETSDWHTHEFGQLISARAGAITIGTPTRVLLLSPAMVLWIPPDTRHWMRCGANNEMLYVDINRAEAQALGSACRIMAMTPLMGALMVATLPSDLASRPTAHHTALYDLLRLEVQAARDVPLSVALPQDRRVRALAEHALDNPGAVSSLTHWLAGAAASRKTIERIFLAETGMTPLKWLRHARLLHAVSRLAEGEKVSTVALDLGYESSSAFSYMFRQTLGLSPTDFCGRVTHEPGMPDAIAKP